MKEKCCVMVFYVCLCRSVCWFLYGPCCHCALKLDISSLFTTFFFGTSLQFILRRDTPKWLKISSGINKILQTGSRFRAPWHNGLHRNSRLYKNHSKQAATNKPKTGFGMLLVYHLFKRIKNSPRKCWVTH